MVSTYLRHHGIKGMKWGVRRFQNPDGSWTAAGRERYGKGGSPRHFLGGESSGSGSSSDSGSKPKPRPSKNGSASSKDPETGFHKMSKRESDSDRLSRCNPNYKLSNDVTPYNRNCGNTVIADELRKRGLDVEARGNNLGVSVKDMDNFFTELDPKRPLTSRVKLQNSTVKALLVGNEQKATAELRTRGKLVQDDFSRQLASAYPEGSRGALNLTGIMGSHWVSFDIKDGKAVFSNPQDPDLDLLVQFGGYKDYGKSNPATAVRLDNAKPNKETIGNVVMNYGDKKTDANGMDWNPLRTKGNEWIAKNPKLEQSVYDALGNKWDGSWEVYKANTKEYIKKADAK